jgi:hypothetical protein
MGRRFADFSAAVFLFAFSPREPCIPLALWLKMRIFLAFLVKFSPS